MMPPTIRAFRNFLQAQPASGHPDEDLWEVSECGIDQPPTLCRRHVASESVDFSMYNDAGIMASMLQKNRSVVRSPANQCTNNVAGMASSNTQHANTPSVPSLGSVADCGLKILPITRLGHVISEMMTVPQVVSKTWPNAAVYE
jgi:hypothetical protein